MKKIFLVIALFFIFCSFVSAEESCDIESETCDVEYDESTSASYVIDFMEHNPDDICIIYFYTTICPKCAKLKPWLEDIEEKYGDKIHVNKLEISRNLENYQLYNKYCGVQNIPLESRGVPMMAIGNTFFMGSNQIKDNLESEIDSLIASDYTGCPLPDGMGCHDIPVGDVDVPTTTKKITLPLVLGAGLIDGINPCAFAVLIFLITFLINISSTKRRMVRAGTMYILSVYITYLIAGLGLLTVIQVSGMSRFMVYAAATFAVFAGLVNVKDYFWYGKGFSLKIPKSMNPTIEKWTRKGNVPAAIVLGFLVSMFELPCTGGVYLAILAMLASTTTNLMAFFYLLLYNVMFVLPLIIILFLVTKGMKAEHIENWRLSKKNWMRLAMGLFLLLLGIGMFLGWF
ncbi:MAG: cytochrome c biogenesis protein [Nanoarchaeota archaeon]|nr:cytochrome c biogenesis protein [Nanoarchaeota archaeon]MCG2717479.1 cytochrome c biogenesis protein [Nanoarchaeota archaeon]